jgi:phage baseplate assembly protein W
MATTRKYSDLDAAFAPNPSSGDLSLRTDEAAVKFAIRNLVMTVNFERPFDSTIGSQVNTLLFEPIDTTTSILLKKMITQTITNHEPRAVLLDVNVIEEADVNTITINIIFKIINTERPLNVTIALDRTR